MYVLSTFINSKVGARRSSYYTQMDALVEQLSNAYMYIKGGVWSVGEYGVVFHIKKTNNSFNSVHMPISTSSGHFKHHRAWLRCFPYSVVLLSPFSISVVKLDPVPSPRFYY